MSYKIFQINASHSLRFSASICTDMTESVTLTYKKVRMIDYERDNHTINLMGFISCAITSLTGYTVAIPNAFLAIPNAFFNALDKIMQVESSS